MLNLDAPLANVEAVHANDPYVDRDGDGWAPGPDYVAKGGITELLFLFKDPNDADPGSQPEFSDATWDKISSVLLRNILGLSSQIRATARRNGITVDD